MFIKLSTAQSEDKVAINTTQICDFVGNEISLSNGKEYQLVGDSREELEKALFDDISFDYTEPGASNKTSELLSELHKLCGGKGEAKPTSDRKARLKARLKDFSEDDLKLAAKNLGLDEFMQGANDNGKRYGTIDYLLRTSANINKWIEEQPKQQKKMF